MPFLFHVIREQSLIGEMGGEKKVLMMRILRLKVEASYFIGQTASIKGQSLAPKIGLSLWIWYKCHYRQICIVGK